MTERMRLDKQEIGLYSRNSPGRQDYVRGLFIRTSSGEISLYQFSPESTEVEKFRFEEEIGRDLTSRLHGQSFKVYSGNETIMRTDSKDKIGVYAFKGLSPNDLLALGRYLNEESQK